MVFDHKVKYNGKWYMPGEEIAEVDKTASESFKVNNTESVWEKEIKKSDITRMSTANLKELANEQGIEGADDMSGSDLKKVLIEHFGL